MWELHYLQRNRNSIRDKLRDFAISKLRKQSVKVSSSSFCFQFYSNSACTWIEALFSFIFFFKLKKKIEKNHNEGFLLQKMLFAI